MGMSLGFDIGIAALNGASVLTLEDFMSSQENGLYFDFTKTDRHFQDNNGGALADDVGESVGLAMSQRLWDGRLLSQQISSSTQMISNGTFPTDLSTWTLTTNGGTIVWTSPGVVTLTRSGGANPRLEKQISVEAGKIYLFRSRALRTSPNGNMSCVLRFSQGGSSADVHTHNTLETVETYYQATSTGTMWISAERLTLDGTGEVYEISLKDISTLPGLQSTGTLKPNRQANGFIKFDGIDDNLLTPYVPTTNNNFIVALVNLPSTVSATQIIAGSQFNTDTRFSLGIDTSGFICGGIGSIATTTIKSSTDRRNQTIVCGITCNENTVRLFDDNSIAYQNTKSGFPTTSQGLRIGSLNNAGTAASFFSGSIKKLIVGREFLTLSQYSQIRNKLLQ